MANEHNPEPVEPDLPYLDPRTLREYEPDPPPPPAGIHMPAPNPLSGGGGYYGGGESVVVTFSPDPVRTGCPPPWQPPTSVEATVSPASATNGIAIAKAGADRVHIREVSRDPVQGKIMLDVEGTNRTPVPPAPGDGDTTIEAKDGATGPVVGDVKAIVL